MNEISTYYETLIANYLNGEATGEELAELNAWLKADAGNLHLFKNVRKNWVLHEAFYVENTTDLDREWDSLCDLIDEKEAPVAKSLKLQTRRSFIRIAAVFLLLIVPSMVYYWFFLPPNEDLLVADMQMIETTLSDGTQVALNTGSILHYPTSFKGKERKVSLEGEAFFDVAHNEKKAFVIDAEDMQIRVLGTSFYVNTNSEENTMEVVLLSGSVQIDFKDKQMLLEPGDKAIILKQHEDIVRQENKDPNLLAWKTKKICFNNTPIYEIIDVLKKVYHKDIIVLNPEINNCRITATFEGQSLEAVLLVLQSTIDITARPNGDTIELSGTGCQ